jgi:hypothetical protein
MIVPLHSRYGAATSQQQLFAQTESQWLVTLRGFLKASVCACDVVVLAGSCILLYQYFTQQCNSFSACNANSNANTQCHCELQMTAEQTMA